MGSRRKAAPTMVRNEVSNPGFWVAEEGVSRGGRGQTLNLALTCKIARNDPDGRASRGKGGQALIFNMGTCQKSTTDPDGRARNDPEVAEGSEGVYPNPGFWGRL